MTRRVRRRREVEEALELGADRRRRSPRASRGRAGSARPTCPTGRRSSRCPPPTSATGRPPWRWRWSKPDDRHEVADVERRPGRVEPVVAGDRPAGRQPRRQTRRRRRGACPASAARRGGPGRPSAEPHRPPPSVTTAVTGAAGRAVSTGRSRGGRPRPLCYRAARHADQPRAAAAPSAQPRHRGRPRGSSAVRRIRDRDPDRPLRWSSSRSAWRACIGVAAAYNYYSQGLPDPRDTLSNLSFDQQTIVTDRTGKIELAEPRRVQARGRHVRPDPARDARRDDRDRGQGLLDEPGLRRRRLRLGDARHAQRPPARRLDDHPAARPGPAPAARARSTAAARSGRSARSSSRSA